MNFMETLKEKLELCKQETEIELAKHHQAIRESQRAWDLAKFEPILLGRQQSRLRARQARHLPKLRTRIIKQAQF